ncbi:hypothetical protein TNCV_964971 [Trichonephila clavipes]|nr:hypothetical protein TNCV_964971 [Trichonephila clavipes]
MNSVFTAWSRKSSRDFGERRRGGRPLTTPRVVPPQNWGETELNRSVTCMVLKAMTNDSRHSALCHDAFRGP